MNITADKAIELLREAVAGKEDFVYQSPDGDDASNPNFYCEYAKDGCPDCLIGVCLHNAGVSVEQLEHLPANRVYDQEVRALLAGYGYPLEPPAVEVFGAAQAMQDSGKPWGEALADAERVYKTVQHIYREGN
jgi:hypothetical protein